MAPAPQREQGTRDRAVALVAAALAIATVTIAAGMLRVFPVTADLHRGFWSPVLAFELARTEADLRFLTGEEPKPTEQRARMDAGHRWDMVFPFAYGGLLAVLLVQLALARERLMWLGVPLALATIPTDINENLVMLEITATLERGQSAGSLLPALYVATWLKWGALALAMAVLAVGLLRRRHRLRGGLAAAGATMIGLAWLTRSNAIVAEAMTLAVFAFFLVAAAAAVRDAWRLRG